MHPERSLEHVQRAFAEGSLADRVVLSLAKFSAGRELSSQDRVALEAAKNFLQSAKLGYGWLDRPEITNESSHLVCSFETAARSWDSTEPPTHFVEELDGMLETVSQLLEGKRPQEGSISSARRFFGRVLRSANEQMDELISKQKRPELARWTLATAFSI